MTQLISNHPSTQQLLSKVADNPGYATSMLSLYDGKIYEGNAFEEGVMRRDNWLFDADAYWQRKVLGASGDKDSIEDAAHIKPSSDRFTGMLQNFKKVRNIHEKTGSPIRRILGAAASGNPLIATEYESVRRVSYLAETRGPQYVMATYNAINALVVKPTTDLQALGFARSGKLAGQPEIADNVTPDLVKNSYTSYFKDIYADSLRYELGMREKAQSVVNLENDITQDLPGAFAKMKDDKAVTALNAITDTTPTTNWLAITGEHFTSHADDDLDDMRNAIREYGPIKAAVMPRAVARAYRRNVNEHVGANKDQVSLPVSMEKERSFALPYHEDITAFVNDGITAATACLVTTQWAILFQGPVIQVAYENKMTPAQMSGKIYFDFNGTKVAVAAAAHQIVGLLS